MKGVSLLTLFEVELLLFESPKIAIPKITPTKIKKPITFKLGRVYFFDLC